MWWPKYPDNVNRTDPTIERNRSIEIRLSNAIDTQPNADIMGNIRLVRLHFGRSMLFNDRRLWLMFVYYVRCLWITLGVCQSNPKIAVIFYWVSIAFGNQISIDRLRSTWLNWFDCRIRSIDIVWKYTLFKRTSPAGTQRCFNVHVTLYGCYGR